MLTGPNGAGKTNLLEAISYLAPGRGLRGARASEVDRRSEAGLPLGGPWGVAATVRGVAGQVRLGTARDPAGSGERRLVRIDGEPVRTQAELAGHLRLVWLTPPMDRLFLEGAGGRRRFLDRLVLALDPAHAARAGTYEHALRERATLLRERGAGADPAWLAALEETLAETGVALAASRSEMAERLAGALAAAPPGPFPRPALAVAGFCEERLAAGVPALAVEEAFRAALAGGRAADGAAGGTARTGPHRSDLVVRAPNGRPAEDGSTGEQKALLVALVLAHARLLERAAGAPPILLLDEVAAHLDAERRAALFAALVALGAQTWLTGTDAALFAGLRGSAQFFAVSGGEIAPAPP